MIHLCTNNPKSHSQLRLCGELVESLKSHQRGSGWMVKILSTRGNAFLVKSRQRKLADFSDPLYQTATLVSSGAHSARRESSVGLLEMI